MSTKKKPVATVKANFNSKGTAPVKEAAKAEETKKIVKEENVVEKKAEKKTAPVKEPAKKAEPVKAEEKKAAPVKAAEKKAEPVKTEEKKAEPAKKAEPVKAEEKKAAPAKKAAKIEAEVILQFGGNDYTYDRLLQSAKDVWQYDQGKNVADFKTAQIYVKPEERKAYVVVNGQDELSFDI